MRAHHYRQSGGAVSSGRGSRLSARPRWVGCSVYVPVMWNGEVFGMFNTAAQARYMFDEADMRVQKLFAALAAGVRMGLGGPTLIATIAADLGRWDG